MVSEFKIIHDFFAPLAAGFPGALGLGDDAAILSPAAGQDLVFTADCLVEGVHFLPSDPPDSIAAKLLGVNLSDLAAMGADPLVYTLTMALPRGIELGWMEAFSKGLGAIQARHGLHLMGGDTVATKGLLTLSVTAIGQTPEGQALRRSGAQPGDQVWVSGTLGDAAAGLRLLQNDSDASSLSRQELVTRYRQPIPRLALGKALRGMARAAIDVSDGLVQDLDHICEESGVSAKIFQNDLPLSCAFQQICDEQPEYVSERLAVSGGDDYELLFCCDPGWQDRIENLREALDLSLTRIGTCGPASSISRVTLIDRQGEEISGEALPGYDHFS